MNNNSAKTEEAGRSLNEWKHFHLTPLKQSQRTDEVSLEPSIHVRIETSQRA